MHVLVSRHKVDGTVATTMVNNAGQELQSVRMTATIFAIQEVQEKVPCGAVHMDCLSLLSLPPPHFYPLHGMHPNQVYNTERYVPARISRLTSVGISNKVRSAT